MSAFLIFSTAFLSGGGIYCLIELLYRKRTHYSMFFCAGYACLIMLGVYNGFREINPFEFAFIGMIVITSLEFIFGVVFNIILKQAVWDYSNAPLNVFGQICLPFSAIWFVFSLILFYIFRLIF